MLIYDFVSKQVIGIDTRKVAKGPLKWQSAVSLAGSSSRWSVEDEGYLHIKYHQIGSTDRGYVWLCNRDNIWHHTIDQLELFSHSVAWIIDHAGYAVNTEFHYALPTSNSSNPSNRYPEGVQVVLGVLNGFQSHIILSFQGWVDGWHRCMMFIRPVSATFQKS